MQIRHPGLVDLPHHGRAVGCRTLAAANVEQVLAHAGVVGHGRCWWHRLYRRTGRTAAKEKQGKNESLQGNLGIKSPLDARTNFSVTHAAPSLFEYKMFGA